MPKFVITSDWHLGYRQYGLNLREQKFYDAAYEVVNYAIDHGITNILHGGDILNVKQPMSRAIEVLKGIHEKLRDNKIKMFVVSGNHDKTKPHWIDIIKSSSDEFGIVLADDLEMEIEGVKTLLLPEMDPDALRERLKGSKSDILLTHITNGAFFDFGDKSTFNSERDLAKNQFKLAVFGDIHVSSLIEHKNGVQALSPGSTVLNSKSEPVQKYLWVAEFNKDKVSVTKHALFTECAKKFKVEKIEDCRDIEKWLKTNKSRNPLAIVEHRVDVGGAVLKIKNAVDKVDGAYAIFEPLYDNTVVNTKNAKASKIKSTSLKDVLESVTDNKAVKTLGLELITEKTDVKQVLSDYVDSQLGKNAL